MMYYHHYHRVTSLCAVYDVLSPLSPCHQSLCRVWCMMYYMNNDCKCPKWTLHIRHNYHHYPRVLSLSITFYVYVGPMLIGLLYYVHYCVYRLLLLSIKIVRSIVCLLLNRTSTVFKLLLPRTVQTRRCKPLRHYQSLAGIVGARHIQSRACALQF